jgi:hypothetical protein
MPVDFDEDDISGAIESAEQPIYPYPSPAAQARRDQIVQQYHEAQSIDDQMTEVEKRLEMAQYYRLVLNDTIFNDPPNVEVADRVEGEIREFVRSRMSLLVGVGEEKKPETLSLFSDAEILSLRTIAQPDVVAALKALAAKVLKKPEILDAKPRVATPEKPKAVREPTLKKIVRTPAAQPTQPRQQTPSPAAPVQGGRGRQQKRVLKKVLREDGSEGVVDVTPPAQPVGVKPFPTPVGRAAIEATAAQTARQQAMVAVANLDKQFSGK